MLNSQEAADALDISQRHLWQLEHDGELTAIRFGRSKKYSMRELERFVSDQQKREDATDELANPIDEEAT